jgi:hypothetical protein
VVIFVGGSTSDALMEAKMTNIANTECASRWSSVNGATIYNTHICPFEQYKSACNVSRLSSAKKKKQIIFYACTFYIDIS